MSNSLDSLFAQFHHAASAAQVQQDKWLIIDAVYEQMEALQAQPLDALLPRILALVEAWPELDYGGPGPFGSLIEEHPMASYTPALAASLLRQPSTQVIGWLDRTTRADADMLARDPNPVGPVELSALLEKVLQHAAASDDCKAFAQLCLNDLRTCL